MAVVQVPAYGTITIAQGEFDVRPRVTITYAEPLWRCQVNDSSAPYEVICYRDQQLQEGTIFTCARMVVNATTHGGAARAEGRCSDGQVTYGVMTEDVVGFDSRTKVADLGGAAVITCFARGPFGQDRPIAPYTVSCSEPDVPSVRSN